MVELRRVTGTSEDNLIRVTRGGAAPTKISVEAVGPHDFWQAVFHGWKLEARGAVRDMLVRNSLLGDLMRDLGKGEKQPDTDN